MGDSLGWAFGVGGAVVIAYSIYARAWVPFRGVKLLSEQLALLTEGERDAARRSWVVRNALLQAGVLAFFVGTVGIAGLADGAWESTWRHTLGALVFPLLLPVAGGLGGWVYYHFQARRTINPELSPLVRIPVGQPVAAVDRGYLRSRYRATVLRCLLVSLMPAFLAFTAIPMVGGTDAGAPNSGTIDRGMLAAFGIMALVPLVVVPLQGLVFSPRSVKSAANPAAAIIANSIAEYAMWAISPLMGYVIFFMGGTWFQFAAATGLAVVGWAFTFPRLSRWMRLADLQDQMAVTFVVP